MDTQATREGAAMTDEQRDKGERFRALHESEPS
jgi:hypothetical protein